MRLHQSGTGEAAVLRFGITGHVNLTPSSEPLVYQAIRDALGPYAGADLVGVSCIAPGADSIFARVVLDLGGRLEVLVPAENYRAKQVPPEYAAAFDDLVTKAVSVRVLPYAEADSEAYEAVWDGRSDGGRGSTASVVRYAQSHGKPVQVIWPEGAERR
jgi:hypothetical protein